MGEEDLTTDRVFHRRIMQVSQKQYPISGSVKGGSIFKSFESKGD